MSRIGKNPIAVPSAVQVSLEQQQLTVKGKLGQLAMQLHDEIDLRIENQEIHVQPRTKSKLARNMWGTTASLVRNMITGVTEGFSKTLEITGVGYRAAVQGKELVLQLGFSHEVRYPFPEGITMACEKPTQVTITGYDKQKLGQIASEIRAFRPPEPFKGKGVRYADETILRKEGKKK